MKASFLLSAGLPIVMTVMTACAGHPGSSGSVAAAAPAIRDGRYTFDEKPVGTPRTLEGTFVVLRDTILVDATPGPCRYDTHSTAGGPITYQCADVSLSFDRRDPVMKATYAFITTEPKPKVVCTRFTIGPNGAQQCAESRTEFVDQTVRHTGTLRAHRMDESPTPPPRPWSVLGLVERSARSASTGQYGRGRVAASNTA
jgi:hypothetical protein